MSDQANSIRKIALPLLCSLVILVALLIYARGLWQSPLLRPELRQQEQYCAALLAAHQQDARQESRYATAYWQRYGDVRRHPLWGEDGPLGVWGPRDHYRQHGRREGRLWQPLLVPGEAATERPLAEAYWQRYPEIRDSTIWGERSLLGVFGPRDHYHYLGRYQGYQWGALVE